MEKLLCIIACTKVILTGDIGFDVLKKVTPTNESFYDSEICGVLILREKMWRMIAGKGNDEDNKQGEIIIDGRIQKDQDDYNLLGLINLIPTTPCLLLIEKEILDSVKITAKKAGYSVIVCEYEGELYSGKVD